jgi:tetratricopeptide (TPR) repeat protein
MSDSILSSNKETKLDLKSAISEDPQNINNSNSKGLATNIRVNREVDFTAKLEVYVASLHELQVNPSPSNEIILQLLLSRDIIQKILDTNLEISTELILKLSDLDEQLRSQEEPILKAKQLPLWRSILRPSEDNWWWFLGTDNNQIITESHSWDRFDWIWNLLTILCLTGFVSFASKIIPLVFSDGISVFESIGLVGPSGMIAFIISNMQGGDGHRKIQNFLHKLGIPVHLQSEIAFSVSLILFLGGYLAQENLPKFYFQKYISEGEKEYKGGHLSEARDKYQLALRIDIKNIIETGKIYTKTGLIEESLGNNANAEKDYYEALSLGDNKALNNLARVKISQGDLDDAETLLNMGIHRQQTSDPNNINDRYQLYRNLGWTYLERANYPKAEEYLNQAIALDKQLPNDTFGKGVANCLQARVYDLQKKPVQAANQWKICVDFALPETLHEYRTIVQMNPEIARKINTKGIFN